MGGHKKATRKLTGFNPERITARSPVNKLTPLSKTYRAGDDVYRSSTYRKESQQLREQSNGICQLCGKQVDRVLVDHIIEIKDGGTDTPDNRMVICYSCHKYKTDAEKRRRMGEAL